MFESAISTAMLHTQKARRLLINQGKNCINVTKQCADNTGIKVPQMRYLNKNLKPKGKLLRPMFVGPVAKNNNYTLTGKHLKD
jgi:hypothetical protein